MYLPRSLQAVPRMLLGMQAYRKQKTIINIPDSQQVHLLVGYTVWHKTWKRPC